MSKELFFQAIGAERIEALCDAFEAELRADLASEGKYLGARFSPGYGDLPLTLQRDVFAALKPEKTLGLTLGENLLMTPTKTVTAIAGF